MTSRFSSRDSLHVLQRLDENQLLLGPSSLGAWVGYTFILAGTLVILSKPSNGPAWIFGLFFVLIGCLTRFGPATTLWDKKTGFLKIRRFLFLDQYPLPQIRDIRVIPGHYLVDQQRVRQSYQSFVLVLRLGNADEEQLNLLENGAEQLQLVYGQTIARFLGVPFVDERLTATERHSQGVLQSKTPNPRVFRSEQAQANWERWALKRAQRKATRAQKGQ